MIVGLLVSLILLIMLILAGYAFQQSKGHVIHMYRVLGVHDYISRSDRINISERVFTEIFVSVYALAMLLLAWEAVVDLGLVNPLLLAAPSQAIPKIASIAGEASVQLAITFLAVGLAFAIATVIGVPLGLVIGSRRYLYEVSDPFIVTFYSIPKVLFLPLFIVWIGIGIDARILYAAYAGVFPIVINTVAAVRDINPNHIYYARTAGATTKQMFLKVLIPNIVPMLLTGLRLALAIIMTCVLLAEMYMPFSGIGSLITKFAETLSSPELYASIIMVAILSAAVVLSLLFLEAHLNRWRHKGLELEPIRF